MPLYIFLPFPSKKKMIIHESKCIQEIVGAIFKRLFPNKVLIRTRPSFQDLKYGIDVSSSHQSWDHDVFISFSAVDTRMNFVDHLYTAFDQRSIHTYKEDDETLANRKSVGSFHCKAIEQSRISVIVFSKNYANSSVCLDDLAYIMMCMNERGQIVLPIFYDVDPCIVGRRFCKYGEAFAQNELINKNKVEIWRKALMDASDISGWLVKFTANGRESKCVKEIADTVSNRLFPYKALRPGAEHLKIPLEVILLATNTFARENIIAGGGFGKVYLGQSKQHGTVAIKQLDRRNGQGDHEFMMEIALLSTYKHDKVVSLVGFCDQEGEKILVYKYESNGSLDKHLFSKDLTWIQRLRICLDVAHGLRYIHDDVGHQHRILHRDVKSSNILLDENWNAKISDFGLSKIALANVPLSVLISNPCGTLGYIDPQYKDNNILTQKCDVYSFGVVLFEVLCGKLVTVAEPLDDRHFSVKSVKTHYEEDTLDEVIDSDLRNQMDSESLSTFSKIAYDCLKEFGEERPTMSKVVKKLKKALDRQLVVAAA
nr:Toll/interleukin-1 receptor (TIR) domain-containing protein [Tanacetum cinerariifolium]